MTTNDLLKVLRNAREALSECEPSRQAFDFGPAYEASRQRRAESLRELRDAVKEMEARLDA